MPTMKQYFSRVKYVQVNLIEWLKMMVNAKKAEEVVDTRLDTKPTTRALKRALLIALRCVDPDSDKRPKMGQIVQMLESDDFPFRKVMFLQENQLLASQ